MAKKTLTINKELCKECGLCIQSCLEDALSFDSKYNAKGYHSVAWNGKCKLCGRCYIVCPDSVIEIEKEKI